MARYEKRKCEDCFSFQLTACGVFAKKIEFEKQKFYEETGRYLSNARAARILILKATG